MLMLCSVVIICCHHDIITSTTLNPDFIVDLNVKKILIYKPEIPMSFAVEKESKAEESCETNDTTNLIDFHRLEIRLRCVITLFGCDF